MIKRSKTLTKAATAATANKSTLHVMKPHPKQDRQSTRKKPGKKKRKHKPWKPVNAIRITQTKYNQKRKSEEEAIHKVNHLAYQNNF